MSRSTVWAQLGEYVRWIQLSGSYRTLLQYEKANLWERRKGRTAKDKNNWSRVDQRERTAFPSNLFTAKGKRDGGRGGGLSFTSRKLSIWSNIKRIWSKHFSERSCSFLVIKIFSIKRSSVKDLGDQKGNIIFITVFSWVLMTWNYDLLCFCLLQWALHVEQVLLSSPCCTAMFLQWPRMDKPNTGSREKLFYIT